MATRAQIQPGLRYLTLLTTGIATPLCIAMSIISASEGYSCRWYRCPRRIPAWPFVFLPLSLTAAASAFTLVYRRKHNRMPNFRWALLDLLALVAYLGVLIPIWAIEVGRLNRGGWGLLSGYASSPMIVNMLIHLYFFLASARLLWTWLSDSGSDKCPHCHGTIGVLPQHQETVQRGEGYSLLRGEGYLDVDADPVAYSDGRPSEDQVGVTDDAPEDKVGDSEPKAKLWKPDMKV